MGSSFIPFAVLSGFFAALSSVFAKLFTDERTAVLVATLSTYFSKYYPLGAGGGDTDVKEPLTLDGNFGH
jgi:hypothetical protein